MKLMDALFDKKLETWLKERVGHEFFKENKSGQKYFQEVIDDLKPAPLVVTVAGTNGKGETCLNLEELFLGLGLSTALFTSPHILSPLERFRFGNQLPSVDYLLQVFEDNRNLCEVLSYYEFLFYCFLKEAIKERIDVLILEVGLGGRKDTVNYLDPDITALTSIGRDHTEILGDELKDILREKLGITRPGAPLVSAVKQSELLNEIGYFCERQKTPLYHLEIPKGLNFKVRNSILAQKIFQIGCQQLNLKCPGGEKEIKVREKTSFGRGSVVTSSCGRFILTGAHNRDGLIEVVRWITEKNANLAGVIAGFSRKRAEDLRDCLAAVCDAPKFAERYFVCSFAHSKATPAKLLEEEVAKFKRDNIFYHRKISKLLVQLKNPDEHYLVLGSYYFLGEFLRSLHDHTDLAQSDFRL